MPAISNPNGLLSQKLSLS